MPDKVIVTSRVALLRKYGDAGAAEIDEALKKYIAADATIRGLETIVVHVDDEMDMGRVGEQPAIVGSDYAYKRAIDSIYRAYDPDYLLILGAPDVVPHIKLRSPLHATDGEPDVDSDLPYASDHRHARSIEAFVDVSRVVGRLPDIQNGRDPSYLVRLLENASSHRPINRESYAPVMGLSAVVWRASTEESVEGILSEPPRIAVSPPDDIRATQPGLDALTHFVNCHGAPLASSFFGEDKTPTYPTALEVDWVLEAVRANTLAAVECCYGAALFDPALEDQKRLPFGNAYLSQGAVAYVGSTCISYGPPAGNGAADLIAQWFLEGCLKGISVGHAFLEARQRFIEEEGLGDPIKLKTIAQFILLGDPSVVPVRRVEHTSDSGNDDSDEGPAPGVSSDPDDSGVNDPERIRIYRQLRRSAMISKGLSLSESTPYAQERPSAPSGEIASNVTAFLASHGIKSGRVFAYPITGGKVYREAWQRKHASMKPSVLLVEALIGLNLRLTASVPEVCMS